MAVGALLPDQQIYAIPYPYRTLTLLLQAAALLGMVWGVWQTDALDFAGVDRCSTKHDEGLGEAAAGKRVVPLRAPSALFLRAGDPLAGAGDELEPSGAEYRVQRVPAGGGEAGGAQAAAGSWRSLC